MSETIKRYSMFTYVDETDPDEDAIGHEESMNGQWVKHSDHLAALSAKDRELEKAVFALRQKDAAMDEYARIVARMDTALRSSALPAGQWRRCSDVAPPVAENVLVAVDGKRRAIAWHRGDLPEWCEVSGRGPQQLHGVTHWMPLPAPPASDARGEGEKR